ncbi:histidine kinase [Actinomadura sp. DC4]|uniref:sensor histidine kinase n=1 Tax=Actinomadura sp. DC4 TaxID=3055069 RepID=UPI0025B0BA2D|nr:histidine kinase [Actinomadura sp. DC4]MDN3359348.1 histidine kinase [Actinomadura sp. DC4]
MTELRGLLRPVTSAWCSTERLMRNGPLVRSGALVVGTLWFLYAMLRDHPGGPRFGVEGADLVLTAGSFAAVACFLLGLVLHRHSYGYLAFLASTGFGVLLYAVAPSRPSSAIAFACVGFAGAAQPLLRSGLVAAVATVGMLVVVLAEGRPAGELWTIVGMLGMLTGIRAGRTREAARQTEQQNLVLAERSRIAREIHDILAHSLSAQLVHLEGARLLMVSGRTDEALDRVERARGLARSGLEETRRALATLRGDIPPMDVVLRELAEEHRLLADASCAVTITGVRSELPAKAGLAVIRTAQEALTNARKHAPGAAVVVALRYTDSWCELEVTDTGGTREPGPLATSGGGYGLVGMRERAELIGGTLEAGPAGEGFRVLLRVPL